MVAATAQQVQHECHASNQCNGCHNAHNHYPHCAPGVVVVATTAAAATRGGAASSGAAKGIANRGIPVHIVWVGGVKAQVDDLQRGGGGMLRSSSELDSCVW